MPSPGFSSLQMLRYRVVLGVVLVAMKQQESTEGLQALNPVIDRRFLP